MKTLKNIPLGFKIEINGRKIPATVGTTVVMVLSQPPAGGFDFQTMRTRFRIADLVEKAGVGEEIPLEDADFDTVKKCVGEFRWSNAHHDIPKFGAMFGL